VTKKLSVGVFVRFSCAASQVAHGRRFRGKEHCGHFVAMLRAGDGRRNARLLLTTRALIDFGVCDKGHHELSGLKFHVGC
jgi:hypothetical protein